MAKTTPMSEKMIEVGDLGEYNLSTMREELDNIVNGIIALREYLEELQFHAPEEGATFQAMDYARVHLALASEALESEIDGLGVEEAWEDEDD